MEAVETAIDLTPKTQEFNGGSFKISYFAPPEGFTIVSNNLTRRSVKTPEIAKGINKGNKAEVEFQNRLNQEANKNGRDRNVNPLASPDFKIKVAISDIKSDGKTLSFTTRPSTFVMYNDEQNVGLTTPENQHLREELGSILGVAIILTTTEPDGSSKLIVQHRSPKNRSYGDIIGASAAGLADQELDPQNPGALKPIDGNYIKNSVQDEMEEELGIDPDYLTDIKITGLAEDLLKVHHEALLMGKVGLSAQQILELSKSKENKFRKEFDFSEKFFIIDGSPKSIKTLITQVKNPIPPTHMGALVAAGRIMVAEKDGEAAAAKWTREVELGSRLNTQEINNLVKLATNGEQTGYNPKKIPTDQGLPDVLSELKRTGLIKTETEKRTIDEICVFDVDGVITEPSDRLFDPEILEQIANRLNNNEPVILNTGRSISWVQERIIARLYFAHNVIKKEALQNLFVVGEKGGTWLTFDENGYMKEHKDETIAVPEDLQNAVKHIVEEQFPKTMFYDHTKHTMISIEMQEINDTRFEGENKLEDFQKDQQSLIIILRGLLKQWGSDESLKIDPTIITTDIENTHVGKDFAMHRVEKWLREKGIEPKKYLTFGDSHSDIAMAQQLHRDGKNVEFIYVGNKPLEGNFEFPVTVTDQKFNKGTSHFLKNR